MKVSEFIYYLLFFLVVGLFSVPTSAETVDSYKNIPASQTGLSEVSGNSKLNFFFNNYSAKQLAEVTRENRVTSDEKKVSPKFKKASLVFSDETKWLSLLYLIENGKLVDRPNRTSLFLENRKFLKNPELVDSWAKLKDAPDAIRKNIALLDDVAGWPASWKLTKSGDGMVVTNSTGRQLGTVYPDKIVAPGRKVSGETGNALLNRSPLVKNMTYDIDGFLFQTDELGRVLKTNADLDDVVRIRLGNQQIKAVDVKDGVGGTDQGGHIVGSRFFGPGEQINLYPQSANLNQGAWKQMENTWADAMVQGKDVKIQVEAVFNGTSQRPTKFEVKYTIDGQPFSEIFINQ